MACVDLVRTRPLPMLSFKAFYDIKAQDHPNSSSQAQLISGLHILASQCSWFGRVWVVQEAYFAKAALVLWGREEIDFRALCRLVIASRNRIPLAMAWIVELFKVDRYGMNFFEVLDCVRHLACSNNRDRIYAVLGFPYKDSRIVQTVEPDYTSPVYSGYYELACNAIEKGSVFDLLQRVDHRPSLEESPTKLPSWTPDWSKSSTISFPRTSTPWLSYPHLNPKRRRLELEGVYLSNLQTVSKPFQFRSLFSWVRPLYVEMGLLFYMIWWYSGPRAWNL
jgi:hypothetical protein